MTAWSTASNTPYPPPDRSLSGLLGAPIINTTIRNIQEQKLKSHRSRPLSPEWGSERTASGLNRSSQRPEEDLEQRNIPNRIN